MKRLWWIGGIAAALVFLYFTALPGDLAVGRDDDGGGLAGTYTVNGVDSTGAEYSGTAVIVGDDGRNYDVEWIITGAVQRGSGVFDGRTFTVEWEATSSAADAVGVTVYEVPDEGPMVGDVRVSGVDGVGSESLFPEP